MRLDATHITIKKESKAMFIFQSKSHRLWSNTILVHGGIARDPLSTMLILNYLVMVSWTFK